MFFNSWQFVVFFFVVTVVHFWIPHRWRWALLLVASYYFYAFWNLRYALLLMASTIVDYSVGMGLSRVSSRAGRLALLGASLSANLGLLFAFKYYNLFRAPLQTAIDAAGAGVTLPVSDLLLPMGISFYTFQTLAYTIDVYRGIQPTERHLGRFALYVSFFPQLVAGPIERAESLLPELARGQVFDARRAADGLKLMVWGLFKKVVIADRLAALVDAVYADPGAHSGPALAAPIATSE